MKRSLSRRLTGLVLLCSFAVTGCYRAVAVPETPAPATRIVATLSPAGAEALAATIGADAVEVEGHVVRWSDTEAELELVRVDYRGPRSVLWNRERVVFPVTALRDVRQRTLDTRRTAAFVGAVATTVTVLAIIFFRFVGGSDEGGNGGTDPAH
jgi:hypothetical protein